MVELIDLLENVNEVNSGFCRTDIVVGTVGTDFCTALGTGISVKAGVHPTDTELGFKVPVATENPRVAVATPAPTNHA